MSNGFPEPVTGENICPKCKGMRALPIDRDIITNPQTLIWGPGDRPCEWCEVCGGEGTASAALERVLIK